MRVSASPSTTFIRTIQPAVEVRVETVEKSSLNRYRPAEFRLLLKWVRVTVCPALLAWVLPP